VLGRESDVARRSQAAADADWLLSANPAAGTNTAQTRPAAVAIRMGAPRHPLDSRRLRAMAPIMTAGAPLFNGRVTGTPLESFSNRCSAGLQACRKRRRPSGAPSQAGLKACTTSI
jgi:hypothetical protein